MIEIIPMDESRVEGFWRAVDEVARERRWLGGVRGFPLETTRAWVTSLIERGMPQVAAVDGEDVIGWCDIDARMGEGFRHVGRLGMGVRAPWRGQGIGHRLMEAALDGARKIGLARVELEVYASNTAAIHLYEKAGFAREGRHARARLLDGVYDDVVTMALFLTPVQTWRVVNSDPAWPAQAETLIARLQSVLGPLAARIDHIGSTAVPGLAAKDILDIQVTLPDLDAATLAAVAGAMTAAGFVHRSDVTRDHRPPGSIGPDSDWEKAYFKTAPGERPAHIHVRAAGRPNQAYPLRFRDFLRGAPEVAEAYARLKRELARYHAHDGEAYTDIKDPVVDLIWMMAG
jgi:GrpB-like predicted nucleotidyltransferase (UPF0157 family)/ribosomal protein S18 acetylase RimI-like enzyme